MSNLKESLQALLDEKDINALDLDGLRTYKNQILSTIDGLTQKAKEVFEKIEKVEVDSGIHANYVGRYFRIIEDDGEVTYCKVLKQTLDRENTMLNLEVRYVFVEHFDEELSFVSVNLEDTISISSSYYTNSQELPEMWHEISKEEFEKVLQESTKKIVELCQS